MYLFDCCRAVVEAWRQVLGHFPNRLLTDYILTGLSEEFRIGFDYSHWCVSMDSNIRSAPSEPTNYWHSVNTGIAAELSTLR